MALTEGSIQQWALVTLAVDVFGSIKDDEFPGRLSD